MKPPHPIKYQPTAIQELFGVFVIVGAIFLVSLCEIFGIIGFIGKTLKKLI